MFTPKLVKAQSRVGFKIGLKFADCVTGEVDLSHLAGKVVSSAGTSMRISKNKVPLKMAVGSYGQILLTWTLILST